MATTTLDELSAEQLSTLASSLKALMNALDDAYWSASDINSKDTLYSLNQSVTDVYDSVVAAQISADDSQLGTFQTTLTNTVTSMQNTEKQINNLTKSVQDAAAVASAIDQAINTAKSVGLLA